MVGEVVEKLEENTKENLAKKDDIRQKRKDVVEEKIQKKIENNYNNIC